MSTIHGMNRALYDALKLLLPGLPERVSKLTLTLESSKPPTVEVEYLPTVDGEIKLPVEFKTDAYVLCPAHLAKLIDVTAVGDEIRTAREIRGVDEYGAPFVVSRDAPSS